MAVQQALCTSFKRELLEGLHDFSTHTFRLALYTSAASLGASTEEYTTTGEVSGSGYASGGEAVTVLGAILSGTTAVVSFEDVAWLGAEFTARGALLYNETSDNRAVAVLDFGADRTVSGGAFTVQMPPADATSALIRIL